MPKQPARNRDNQKSIYGLIDKHASWLNQSLTEESSPTFSGMTIENDVLIGGDVIVNGLTTLINTDVLAVKDNIIEINSGETGPGVTIPSGLSGLRVNRGSSTAYQFVFRESDDAFCIGQENDIQTVATREDNPLDKGIMIFNDNEKRLDSVTSIPLTTTFSSGEVAITSETGALRITGGLGITGDIYSDGVIKLKGLDYTNSISTDVSQNTVITSTSGLNLNVATNVKIPINKSLIFDTTSHSIFTNGTDFTVTSSGAISITPGSGLPVNLTTNSPLTFGSSSNSLLYNGTDMILQSSGVFVVNPITLFSNNAAATTISNGGVRVSGGISISNLTDAISSSNGGSITTAGGVGIAKKLFVAGLSTFENTDEAVSIQVNGGVSVMKRFIVGSNYSSNPSLHSGIFIQNTSSTFTDNTTNASGTVSSVNFNYLGASALHALNSNITTSNAATLYIEGSPIEGTNQTISNSYSLYIDSGITRLNGDVQIKSATESTSLTVDGGVTINKNLNVNSKFDVGADIASGPSSSGVFLSFSPRTVTDDVTLSGTVPEMLFNFIAQPSLSSTNVITTTDSSTFTIGGAPIQSGNQTLTNAYSMWIKSGILRSDGKILINDTTDSTSSSSSSSLKTLGGVSVGKKLYVSGISTFEDSTEASDSTSGAVVVSGGIAVDKNINVARDIKLGLNDYSGVPGLGKILSSGGNIFTDSSTISSGTQASYSTNEFKQTTLAAANTSVTTTDSYTVYIQGPPLAGTNQTLTNAYSLSVASGNSKFGGNVEITGELVAGSQNITGNFDVDGLTTLDQLAVITDDGAFSVSGSNNVNINVGDTCTITNTSGNVIVDSQAGVLTLDGNNGVTIDSQAGISIDAETGSNINVVSGTLSIGAPTLTTSSDTTSINATTQINIGTTTPGLPISIGNSLGETTVNNNLSVTGNLTVQGETTILNSTIITTEDNAIVVNSMPAGISDGGFLVKRFQPPNNTGLGKVITDTPYETGTFQGDLMLGTGASTIVNLYRGWWIKITSGVANGYVRRIKSNDASRNIVVYATADNNDNFSDGLDIGVTILAGDSYELYSGAYVGMFFNDTLSEWSIGNVPFDQGAGVFPLFGYRDLHINSLLVEQGLSLTGQTLSEGTIVIDNDTTQTLLIRKDDDLGDVFYVDTVNPSITLSNPVNTVGSKSYIKLSGLDSTNAEVVYSQLSSEIKTNTTGSVVGSISIGVVRNSAVENYIVLDGDTQKTTISSLVELTDSTSSTSTTAAIKVTGGITSLSTTDATSMTSGGGFTTLGGATITKNLYIGSDLNVNMSATGNGTISISPSITDTESSISFYGDLASTGQLWKLGHAVPSVSINSFGVYNSTSTSLALEITTSNNLIIPSTTSSTNTTTGALVIGGGVGVTGNINASGNITGTWDGSIISVAKGGTGVSSFTSTRLLIGNGSSAINTDAGLVYSSSTLSTPRLVSTDTTDSSSTSTGGVVIQGGVGIAKKLYIGDNVSVNGNISFVSTDVEIGQTTADASDDGSITVRSGGALGDSRGSSISLRGNENASNPGQILLSCGNVNSSGNLSVVTSSIERFRVNYDGSVNITSTVDSTSPTTASLVLSGGASIAKKLYIGTDLEVTGSISFSSITSGSWNGSTIGVEYGGTGATSLTQNSLLIGNGTSALSTSANLTFATNILSTPKLNSTDTSQSTSSSTGAVTLLGGMGVAKNVYLGEDLIVSGFIGAGVSTNVNSALTLSSGSNIGVNTVVSSDTGSLSISGSGVGLASRGSIVNMYGIDHATLPGELNLQAGSTSGSLKLSTGGVSRVTVSSSGNTTFSKTGDTTSNSTGTVVISGGVGISNTTNSISNTNGGALTVGGGCAIERDLYVGGNLYMTGTVPGAVTILTPTVTSSSLVNISSSTAVNVKLRKTADEKSLSCVFNVSPSSVRSTCSFEFTLPDVSANLVNVYDIVCSINGYLVDFTPVENCTIYGVTGTPRGKIRFTSGPTTDNHSIQVIVNYS